MARGDGRYPPAGDWSEPAPAPDDWYRPAPESPRRGGGYGARDGGRPRGDGGYRDGGSGGYRGDAVRRQRADDGDGGPRTARRAATGGRAGSSSGGSGSGGSGSGGAGRGHRRRKAKKRGPGRFVKPVLFTLVMVLVLGVGTAWAWYNHLNSNLTKGQLDAGKHAPPKAKADKNGNEPINILLIGTDSRKGLNGKFGDKGNVGWGNNDVNILLHVYPDHKTAVALNLPRDTMVDIPECTTEDKSKTYPASTHVPFNSALHRGGPGCVVATAQKLTHIHIDHFIMINFKGVEKMANAVGGVEVNLCTAINDDDSHLHLGPGKHLLKGATALAFVRTRHGVQDGSDLGRFNMQRYFLSSLMRKFTSAGTLTNPTKVIPLAEAATKSLTVDNGIGSVTKLAGLAKELSGVKPDQVKFINANVYDDPQNHNKVDWKQPLSDEIFAAVNASKPLPGQKTTKKKKAKSSKSAAPTVDPAKVSVSVLNGTAKVGEAGRTSKALQKLKYQSTAANAPTTSVKTTTARYSTAAEKPAAQAVAKALGLESSAVKQNSTAGDKIVVMIGADLPSHFPSPTPSALPTGVKVHNASEKECVKGYTGVREQ